MENLSNPVKINFTLTPSAVKAFLLAELSNHLRILFAYDTYCRIRDKESLVLKVSSGDSELDAELSKKISGSELAAYKVGLLSSTDFMEMKTGRGTTTEDTTEEEYEYVLQLKKLSEKMNSIFQEHIDSLLISSKEEILQLPPFKERAQKLLQEVIDKCINAVKTEDND